MSKLSRQAIKGRKQLMTYDFPIDIYNKNVYIYIGQCMEDCKYGAELDFKNLDLSHIENSTLATAVQLVAKEGSTTNLILIPVDQASDYNILTTCAHEAVHIAWYILDVVGISLTVDNHEAQAYLVDYIFGGCKDAIEDYKKKYKLKFKL